MGETAWSNFTVAESDDEDGGQPWSNPNNALTENGSYATCEPPDGPWDTIADGGVQIQVNGVWSPTNNAAPGGWPGTAAFISNGTPTALWGFPAIDVADIPGIKMRLSATYSGKGIGYSEWLVLSALTAPSIPPGNYIVGCMTQWKKRKVGDSGEVDVGQIKFFYEPIPEPSTASAIESQGFLFEIGNGDSPLSYTEVKAVISFNGPDGQAAEIDATHLDSEAKEFLMGLQDSGNITLDANFLSDDTGQTMMRQAKADRAVQDFRMTFSNATALTFQGLVLSAAESGSVDGKVSASFNVRISGPVVDQDGNNY